LKIPAINSLRRSKIFYYRNCYNSKQLFTEFAAGAENLVSPTDKIFTPRIIQLKKRESIKIG